MKNMLITVLSLLLALAMLAPFASFADGGTVIPADKVDYGDVVFNDPDETKDPDSVLWAHNYPVRLLTYKDAEHKQPIVDDWKSGERIYYVLDCLRGYYATQLYIPNAKYIDGESFILGDEAPEIVISYILAGDTHNDGKINAKDVIVLMHYLVDTVTFWEHYGDPHFDFNRDRKVNAKDVTDLMKQMVGKKDFHGGAQTNVKGKRNAATLGTALFGAGDRYSVNTTDGTTYTFGDKIPYTAEYSSKPYRYQAVIKDKAELESALAGWAEPVKSGNEFIPDEDKWLASPSEYIASVTDETFKEKTLFLVSLGNNPGAVTYDGAYYENETLVPYITVYDATPGVECDAYEEHIMIIAFEKLPEDQPIAAHIHLNYPI